MWQYITDKSIFLHKWTLLFAVVFVLFRLLSFVLVPYPYIMSTVLILLMFLFGMLYFQSPPHAFLFLLVEFFLGGSGQYFFAFGISIRSLFLISFLTLTLLHQVGVHFYREQKHIPNWLLISIAGMTIYAITAVVIGIRNHHDIIQVLSEVVPFFYVLIIFPAYAMYRRYSFLRTNTARLAVIAILGTTLFSLLNVILFSTGIAVIGSTYHDWFVSMDKGTIVLAQAPLYFVSEASNILIVPILLIITSLLMKSERHHPLWWLMHASLLYKLVLAPQVWYLIALGVGLIVLLYKHTLARWAGIVLYSGTLFMALFIITSFLLSGFTTSGIPLLGRTLVTQMGETITLGMMQFGAIRTAVEQAPFFGNGFGTSITYFDVFEKTYITTDHYGWRYTELLVKVGLFGMLWYLLLLGGLILTTLRRIRALQQYHDFYVGILASIISLLILQIGIPVLTTTYGIFALMFGVLIVTKDTSSFDQFVIFLYRLFHRKKA